MGSSGSIPSLSERIAVIREVFEHFKATSFCVAAQARHLG